MERLYKVLQAYDKKNIYPFHMPGHKRNQESSNGEFLFECDITEIDGFDDLHHPEGLIRNAQDRMASVYGAKESFFSVNGSTAALLAAVSACVKRGGQILMARNCHKAVYHALYLRNLNPTYMYPLMEKEFGINGGISPAKVDRCLAENPDIEAVLITSPTYDGVVSDVKAIAEIVHKYDIPLIVDEAHGAHFRFSDYFPASAVDLGADLVVQSLHKTLPSMTQTAVLHNCSDRISHDLLQRFMGIYQSSSPSYVLMASMDACMEKISANGENMFREYTRILEESRRRLMKNKKIRLISSAIKGTADIFDYDRSKILLSVKGTSMTGEELHRILLEEFQLQMEMESENYVVALTSVGDTKEGFQRLCEAVEEIEKRIEIKKSDDSETEELDGKNPYMQLNQKISLTEAMEMPGRKCLLEESVGKISTEFVYLYPPGIPILVPGEQITGLFVRNVRRYMEMGLRLQGLKDFTNEMICVIDPC